MKTHTSFVIVDANASANPAREALIPGVKTATTPVTPIAALDSRLNRAESQRFTGRNDINVTAH